ncbi:hypothetical protein Pla100_62980 [Neorhodopirellula pilleata]|uniref:Uncharacterized protein n=1 Tax=Neorhodopirellula pilleata TaxID=2714738 RepID=A0A5C5YU88_9BACT|nr:hypothetical protein Pla100_62980 [Neorhodopirellula pilleata]
MTTRRIASEHGPRERKTTTERRRHDPREGKTTAGRRQLGLCPGLSEDSHPQIDRFRVVAKEASNPPHSVISKSISVAYPNQESTWSYGIVDQVLRLPGIGELMKRMTGGIETNVTTASVAMPVSFTPRRKLWNAACANVNGGFRVDGRLLVLRDGS